MSDQPNNGQRRNNNNRNRNNNNNRNRNNNNRNNNRGNGPRKHTPKPLVLTGWQKFLKVFGLFNEDKARAKLKAQRSQPAKKAADTSSTKKPAQSNTRVAKPRRAPQQIPVETPRLYVGNLSYEATEYDIEELFKGIGTVKKVEIIYNRHTHKSKGYGFVQMLNTDEAKRAVEVLHEQPFMGRNMIVNGSKAKKPNDTTDSATNNESDAEVSA